MKISQIRRGTTWGGPGRGRPGRLPPPAVLWPDPGGSATAQPVRWACRPRAAGAGPGLQPRVGSQSRPEPLPPQSAHHIPASTRGSRFWKGWRCRCPSPRSENLQLVATLEATLPRPCLGQRPPLPPRWPVLPTHPPVMGSHAPRAVAPCDPTPLLSGYLLFRDFCLKHLEEAKPLVEFYEEVRPLLPGERGGGWVDSASASMSPVGILSPRSRSTRSWRQRRSAWLAAGRSSTPTS